MSDKKRRFFSGPSLEAALVSAGSEYGILPEEVNYRVVEKRHGFLKVRRNTVIEVDPEAPRKVKEGKAGKGRGEEKPKAAREPAAEPAKPEPSAKPDPPPRAAKPEKETQAEPEEPPQPAAPSTEERPPLRPRSRGKRMKGRPEKPSLEKVKAAETKKQERPEEDRREPRRQPSRTRPRKRRKGEPKPVEQRLEKAQGEKAEAALESTEWLLDLVDLDVDGDVYEGQDRLEIELRGPDRKFLVADDGKVLSALEHLVPRVMHGVCGEALPVRVDSENFQELREDGLRELAWETADEVRREGQASILKAMDPADRRIVHLALSDDPEVTTRSLGDGFFKRIKVLLK